jgi:AAA family ATP:ADP antiporter
MSMSEPMTGRFRKTALDRVLSLFADVRAGEGVGALLLTFNIFCLLGVYYVLKTVREALILTQGGAEIASYANAGQALLLLVVIPLYSALAARVDRVRLISWVTLFFASHLVVFYLLGVSGVRIGLAFYLWIGIFNMMIVAQFWAFANDLYTNERGKRLFPIVGIGSSLGAWIGALVAAAAFSAFGPYRLLLVSAAGLMLNVIFTRWIDQRERVAAPAPAAAVQARDQQIGRGDAFRLVFSRPYLLYMAILVMVLNLVNTTGEFILNSLLVSDVAQRVASGATGGMSEEAMIGVFKGNFFATVNLVGFLIQALLVSRVIKYLGVRGALFIPPIIGVLSYGSLALLPLFAIIRVTKVIENGTDYSLQNTARQALFLPTSREVKYKAKQVIDSFFVRAGDMLVAGIVLIGTQLALSVRAYSVLNLIFVFIWLLLVIAIAREHRKLVPVDVEERAAA